MEGLLGLGVRGIIPRSQAAGILLSTMRKEIPSFKSEDEEREFWAERDSADFIDWSGAQLAEFPSLRPTRERKSSSEELPYLPNNK
jgi:hypothetical protein